MQAPLSRSDSLFVSPYAGGPALAAEPSVEGGPRVEAEVAFDSLGTGAEGVGLSSKEGELRWAQARLRQGRHRQGRSATPRLSPTCRQPLTPRRT